MIEQNATTTVGVPARYTAIFTGGGAVVGFAAAFVVGPLVSWLLGFFGDAPMPLRFMAELPFAWALPVLTVAGAVAGFLIVASWSDSAGAFEVGAEGITVRSKEADRFVPMSVCHRLAVEKGELIVLDQAAREIFRGPLDGEMVPGLQAALQEHGYPALESADPYTRDFSTWVEGDGNLDEGTEELLRARRRALADKRPGAAEEALDGLRRLGVMVRDRDGRQQYRRL